jgi:hypothetical protein
MNARRILDKLKRVFLKQNKPPTLGRWNIHSHKKTILKIKYANEDNCGISGNDDQYIYMMGYESIHNYL